MKIFANKVANYFSQLAEYKLVLLYGPNYGLTDILKNKIVKAFFNNATSNIITIYNDVLKTKQDALINEIASVGLFEDDKKIIIIKDANDTTAKIIKSCFELTNYPPNVLIIVLCNELTSQSTIKKLCEDRNDCISTACYLDTIEIIKENVTNLFKNNNITINADTLNYLTNQLNQDSLIAQNTLQSLLLYIYPKTNVTIEDIEKLLVNDSITGIDKMINNLFIQNIKQAYALTIKLLETNTAIALLKNINNHLYRLHLVKSAIIYGFSTLEATKLLNPPVFFTNQAAFNQQINKLSADNLKNLLSNITKLEIELKTKNNFSELIFKNFILNFKDFI